ncbi:uncharacterized protein [Drosophila takahashii]|uniref:uncharacterized protein n=1 Tax=Drosophila takahashii TaxID=29030 RepID=UPI001CF830CB|nr:uncharacterized protein LOC108065174 [Drosophila takahashii]
MGDLTNLPMEILDLIFKFLGDLEDKLQLAKVDEVLAAAFRFHCGIHFKYLSAFEVPTRFWEDLLPICGSTIEVMHTDKYEDIRPPYKLIEQYCPNLQFISLHLRFFQDLPNLEKLRLQNHVDPKFEYQMSKWLDGPMNAKEFPKSLPPPINLHDTFWPLKKLCYLDMYGFFVYSMKTNEELNLPALMELRFRCCAILSSIPIMPKLTKCILNCLHSIVMDSGYNP